MTINNANNSNRHRSTGAWLIDRETGDDARVLPTDAQRADARVQPKKQPQPGHVVFREPGRGCGREPARQESRVRFLWQQQPRAEIQARDARSDAPESS